jgi:molybdopterin-biosynthesis enzyme MoeA-like protein
MAQAFARLGIKLAEARVIRDEPEVIAAVVNELRARYTYLFTTGGIGPTHDDLTAESIARAFGVELVIDEEARRRIASSGRELNQARLKMAMVPEGASLIDNAVSLAPGFRIGNVFVLAGVPSIARAMFGACERELEGGNPIVSQSIDVYQREGDFAAALEAIAKRYPEVDIGSYPFSREGRLGASLVVRGTDAGRVTAAMTEIRTTLLPED